MLWLPFYWICTFYLVCISPLNISACVNIQSTTGQPLTGGRGVNSQMTTKWIFIPALRRNAAFKKVHLSIMAAFILKERCRERRENTHWKHVRWRRRYCLPKNGPFLPGVSDHRDTKETAIVSATINPAVPGNTVWRICLVSRQSISIYNAFIKWNFENKPCWRVCDKPNYTQAIDHALGFEYDIYKAY